TPTVDLGGTLQFWRQRSGRRYVRAKACGMTPPDWASGRHLSGMRNYVVHDRVSAIRIATRACRHVIQVERVAGAIRHVVIGARRVAAHSKAAEQHVARPI